MDHERKRALKALGKEEVRRRSAALRAAMSEANPLPHGDPRWSINYKAGSLRERWLKKHLPVLHKVELEQKFVVWERPNERQTTVGSYVLCQTCGSAVPAALPRLWFYWAGCACRNVRWRCIAGWRRVKVRDAEVLMPVTLIGKP